MIRVALLLTISLLLTSCAGSVEMLQDGDGSDRMKASPCACVRVPFDSEGFRWVG